jgi:hypothetical protein
LDDLIKDQVEVDLVITRGSQIWGVGIKSSTSVTSKDEQGHIRLAEQCEKDWLGGILLHAGNNAFPLNNAHNLATPLAWPWEK